MKQFFACLLFALLIGGAASAQRFRIGIRGGINTVDHSFSRTRIGDALVTPGENKIGYEAGFALRLNLTKHLHLQSELNYVFTNYGFDLAGASRRNVTIRTERFEIPVQLGLQFGPIRLFGGAAFRIAHSERSSAPKTLKVRFNDDDIAIMGGIGLNIKKFFIDFRISGYPRSHVWNTFTSDGYSKRVKVSRNMLYGGSIGFFF